MFLVMAPMFKVVFRGEDGHDAPEDDKATADPSGHAHVDERPAKDWKNESTLEIYNGVSFLVKKVDPFFPRTLNDYYE